MSSNEETPSEGGGSMVPLETGIGFPANERALSPEDAVCSTKTHLICLCLMWLFPFARWYFNIFYFLITAYDNLYSSFICTSV